MKEETEEMELAEFSRIIHIALRKGTDSDASVVLWNLMNLAHYKVLISIARDLKMLQEDHNFGLEDALFRLSDRHLEWPKHETWTDEWKQMNIALRYAWKICDRGTRQNVADFVNRIMDVP